MNSRVGVNMRYLGAVGWQPTALIGNNAGYEQQGWGQHELFWGCRLATYSTYWQQCRLWTAGLGPTWGILGLSHLLATMRAMNNRVGVNIKYLGAVGWQPTALLGNNAGYKQQGWGSTWGILGLHVGKLQHLLATMRAMNSRVGVNMRYLGAAYWRQCGLWTAGLGSTWGILGL